MSDSEPKTRTGYFFMKSFLKTKNAWLCSVGRTLLSAALLVFFPNSLAISVTKSSKTSVVIADNYLNGVVQSISFGNSVSSIESIELDLNISGGFNGDYYAYLEHEGGFSVLLNRIGSTAGNFLGNFGNGLDVQFIDDVANPDIHIAGDGLISGTFRPDGREESPFSVTDLSLRTAGFSSFTGLNPQGQWNLFIADVSPGSVGTLVSWSLTVNGQASGLPELVPDSGNTLYLLSAALGSLGLLRLLGRSAPAN